MKNKKNWSEQEMDYVLRSIREWLNSRHFLTKDGILHYIPSISKMEEILGLPYTSCGRAACLGVTNTLLYLDYDCAYHIYSFELDDEGIIYAICDNVDGSELVIPIN